MLWRRRKLPVMESLRVTLPPSLFEEWIDRVVDLGQLSFVEERDAAQGPLPPGGPNFLRLAADEMEVKVVVLSSRHHGFVSEIQLRPVRENLPLARRVYDRLVACGGRPANNVLDRLDDILAGKRPRAFVEYD